MTNSSAGFPAFEPLYPAEVLRSGRTTYLGRITATNAPWTASFDLLHQNRRRSSRALPITHCLKIARSDGTPFHLYEGLDVLDRLGAGMGLWSGRPVNGWRVQLKSGGQVIGNPLFSRRQQARTTARNWAPRMFGGGDGPAFEQLLRLSMDRSVDYQERLLLSWYHTAMQVFTLQSGLAATSSALQLLGKLTPPPVGNETFRQLVQRLLTGAKMTNTEQGPIVRCQRVLDLSTFIDARNETAHAESGASKFTSDEWFDLYRLGRKWLELLLLHRLGYVGKYWDSFTMDAAEVPWETQPTRAIPAVVA